MIFWWTGKGYLTPVILFAVLMLSGLILKAGEPLLRDRPWFWGIAIIVAGAINWTVGRRQNARKLATIRSKYSWNKLIYRARNRFMSLPFETWSIPLVTGGLAAIGYDILPG